MKLPRIYYAENMTISFRIYEPRTLTVKQILQQLSWLQTSNIHILIYFYNNQNYGVNLTYQS